MSLPRLTFLCRLSLSTSICQIPKFCLTPTNPMQPPISRWYNPDKRCDVMVGSSTISSEQFQELQELSLKVGEQETSGVGEGGCHWLYCPPNIFRMTCWSVLGKTQIWPEKLIQEWWWTVNHIVLEFCILFWDHISSFNETCLAFVFLLFWNQQMFNILFWQNILIKLQHAIKANQS